MFAIVNLALFAFNPLLLVISKEVDIDSADAPSIVADAKKKKKSEKEALRLQEEQEEMEMLKEKLIALIIQMF